ncbi:MAG: transcription-repair coupling factor [Ruminococcaceae bacterium]|nr:transcription-repair coupling factor [Oscillospiraceae bacterium]
MDFFSNILKKSDEYSFIEECIKQGNFPLQVSGVSGPVSAHLAASLCKNTDSNGVVIAPSEYDAKKMCSDLEFFYEKNVIFYPSKEIEYYETFAKSNELVNERLSALKRVIYSTDKTMLVMSVDALLQFTIDFDSFLDSSMNFSVGDKIKIQDLTEKLSKLGYSREDTVEGKGQFSVRGGIVDVFSPDAENPCRLEFFGDYIDSIRLFDAITQTSIENAEKVTITSACETSTEKKPASVVSYFDKDALIFFSEPMQIAERAEGFCWDINETVKTLLEREVITEPKESYIYDYSAICSVLTKRKFIALSALLQSPKDYKPLVTASFTAGAHSTYTGLNDFFFEDLESWLKKEYTVILPAGNTAKAQRLAESLKERVGSVSILSRDKDADKTGIVYITEGVLRKGFYYPELKLCVISDEELFGRSVKKQKRFKRTDSASRINSFTDLKPGDYVVHKVHGIGRYAGLDTLTIEGFNKDFLKIEYSGSDVLYVSCDNLELIQKYIGKDGTLRLNKMGGADFARQKSRVKESTKELAEELIKLYSARQYQKGFAFSPDTNWQTEFEARFPYDETDDQLTSIEEVKRDMESERPMDRLLCGDVGYGKTEVALRAAFKAVMDSKQVAFLAPTTVLTMQHYNTFISRMKDYPIKIGLLSRFKTPSEQKKILKQLKNGEIDIIIGTHRLLGNDVEFHDLGLLVVDEEQRFGVKHKERIKGMKNNVDVLTLSATPIPRTLHMSMINIKDMSTLSAPPEDRYPVSTVVTEYNEGVVIDAIKKELSRGGQVYYLHNRVNSLPSIVRHLSGALDDAKVQYAHGQMDEGELEEIMMDMLEGNIDVLVCTTIIETGLDIPNVNTIIIDDADRLGLSQLYQLRGRVGRTNRRAFAYLLYKKDKALKEEAVKRLSAIKEFTEFGSGFKIAMRDLEIRGAGNILGAKQHGHMDSVGYDMYCQILAESIGELSGEPVKEEEPITVDLPVEAHIPPTYIKNHTARLEIYKKIAQVSSEEDFLDISDEITDRFGDMPKSVISLLDIALIKVLCSEVGLKEVSQKNDRIFFYFSGEVDFEVVSHLIAKYKGRILLSAGNLPYFTLNANSDEKKALLSCVKSLLQSFKLLHHKEK